MSKNPPSNGNSGGSYLAKPWPRLGSSIAILVIFTLIWLVLISSSTQLVQLTGRIPFDAAARAVTQWLIPVGVNGGVELATLFASLAVLTTIVIGAVFALPTGGKREIPKESRALAALVSIGVLLPASLISAAGFWTFIVDRRSFELILLTLSAWMVGAVATMINLRRPNEELLLDAELELKELDAAASVRGITDLTSVPWPIRFVSEIAFLGVPAVGAFVLAALGLRLDFASSEVAPQAWAFAVVLVGGSAVTALGWRVSTEYPPRPRDERAIALFVRVVGVLVMSSAVFAAALIGLWWFFGAAVVVFLVNSAVYLFATVTDRVPYLKVLRVSATASRLRKAKKWRDELSVAVAFDGDTTSSFGDDQDHEAECEPWIRIEVRKSRKRRRNRQVKQ